MAKMDKSEIAKQLFSLILGMGMGGAARGGISLSFVPSTVTPGMTANADTFVSRNYPTEFAPDAFHKYDVINIPSVNGNANENQFGKSYSDIIKEAGRMQTLKEHNDAITKYVKMLPSNADPKMVRSALSRGLEEEKRLPQFWNESKSRVPFKVSSSAVTGIRLTPDARIEVQWKNSPKWYSFKQYPDTQQASVAAQKLLQADSIGRAVYPVVSRNVKNSKLGKWNLVNYDSAYA